MPSIRISSFGGMRPKVSPKLLNNNEAQLAENVRLRDGRLHPSFAWQLSQSGTFFTLSQDVSINGSIAGNTLTSRNVFYDFGSGLGLRGALTSGLPIFNGSMVNGSNIVDLEGNSPRPVPISSIYPLSTGSPGTSPWAVVTNRTATRTFLTTTPVARAYAITALTVHGETPPIIIHIENGTASQLFYEGDNLQLRIEVNPQMNDVAVNGYNIYRTVSKPRTGEQLNYDFSTDFLLVREISPIQVSFNSFLLVDNFLDSDLKHKTITSETNTPPQGSFRFLGRLDNGRYWAIPEETFLTQNPLLVRVSKINNPYAWPLDSQTYLLNYKPKRTGALQFTSNSSNLGYITGAVSFRNSIIIGTLGKPIIINVIDQDNGSPLFDIQELDTLLPCVANTLCQTPFGAIYATDSGIVTITGTTQTTISGRVFEFGPDFWSVTGSKISYAFYWDGRYYLIGAIKSDKGICFQVDPNEHTPDFGTLTTFDHPIKPLGYFRPYYAVPQSIGVYALFQNGVYLTHSSGRTPLINGQNQFTFPIKATYRWRSKKFVMAGPTAFSAAKVVHDGSGPLVFNVYVDGRLAYNRAVTHSEPFRLPRSRKGIEWEIELCGQSVVEEVHLATSIEELTESYNNDAG